MTELSTFSVPEFQGRLTERDIAGRLAESEERNDWALWEEESNTPPIWDGPDFSHETVQAPIVEQVSRSHEQQLRHSIEAMDAADLISDVANVTRNMSAIRQQVTQQAAYRSDYALGA